MLSIISLILGPIGKVINAIFGYKTAEANDSATLQVAQIESTAAVEEKWWFVATLIPLFAFPYVAWTWKAVLWDKIIEDGQTSTDALTGPLGTGYWIILTGLFLHAMVNKNG